MLPASNRGEGMNIGFPDVCNTYVAKVTVPLTYPNMGANGQAVGFSQNVMINQLNALNMASSISMTSGDEGGDAHTTTMGESRWVMGNPIVQVNCMPGINLTCPATGNAMNCGLDAQLVPCLTNVFYTLAHEEDLPEMGSSRPLRGGELLDYVQALRDERLEASLLPGRVGVVRLPLFGLEAPRRVRAAIEALTSAGMRKLVLDLRGNRGGVLGSCLRLASDFVEADNRLCTMIDLEGREHELRSRGSRRFGLPLGILIDGGTASAAEIFAGILQTRRRALVLGQRSHGKGSAQRVLVSDRPGEARCATHATCRLPDDRQLDGEGIAPDIETDDGCDCDALLELL